MERLAKSLTILSSEELRACLQGSTAQRFRAFRFMANDYFFQHDYNPTNDPKIQAMYADHGDWGYGLFWRLIEALHRDENHRLPLKSYVFKAFAQHPSTSVEQVQAFVGDCINEYDLLLTDNGLFYSARVDRNIEKRSKISESRSAAGKASALAKQNATNAEQAATSVQQKSTKERKEKESKGEEKKERANAFDRFWDAYARKEDRKAAEAKWSKVPGDLFEFVIEQARKYAAAQPEVKYRKLAATWLHGECWNNEIANPHAKPAPYDPTGFIARGPQRENFNTQDEYEWALEQQEKGKQWW